jgi:hypothetical protein
MPGNDQQALRALREVALGEGPIDFTAPNGQKVTLTTDRDRLSFIAGGLAAFDGYEQATRQSARAETLREAAEKLRERAQQATHYAKHARLRDADFLESLASDNEGKD